MNITYQGVRGSFSHIAATKYFDNENTYLGTKAFKEIFENLTSGLADYGVVPVENTLAGTVYENYDHIYNYPVYAVGEFNLKIEHHLLGIKTKGDSDFKKIQKVYSHIKALEQCTKFFDAHPWIEETVYSDTAGAAEMVAKKKDPTIGAIASETAGKLYGLDVLKKNIEDDPRNYTRFLVLSSSQESPSKENKCSLILTVPHIPGSLHKALGVLAANKMNLTKIESRPIHGKPFEYIFYIDLEFDTKNLDQIKDVIANDLKEKTQTLKILGFYRSARI